MASGGAGSIAAGGYVVASQAWAGPSAARMVANAHGDVPADGLVTERRRPDPGVPWPLVAAALVLLAVIVVAWMAGWV